MASWRVTSDAGGQYDWDAAGNPVSGHVVSFLTGNGNKGSVFVPDDHYNVAAVKALIAGQADVADSIASLSSD